MGENSLTSDLEGLGPVRPSGAEPAGRWDPRGSPQEATLENSREKGEKPWATEGNKDDFMIHGIQSICSMQCKTKSFYSKESKPLF